MFLALNLIFAWFWVHVACQNGEIFKIRESGRAKLESNVRSMLYEAGLPRQKSDQYQVIVPPNYMIRLYHKYTEENLPSSPNSFSGSSMSVRCILGSLKRKSINFNLSSIVSKDQISHAEVHIFRRPFGKLPRVKFFLSRPRSRSASHLEKVFAGSTQLSRFMTGWQALDIEASASADFYKWKEFVVKTEALIPKFGAGGGSRPKILNVKDVIRVSYRPFLLIFSHDEGVDRKRLSKEALVQSYNTKESGRDGSERVASDMWGLENMDNRLGPSLTKENMNDMKSMDASEPARGSLGKLNVPLKNRSSVKRRSIGNQQRSYYAASGRRVRLPISQRTERTKDFRSVPNQESVALNGTQEEENLLPLAKDWWKQVATSSAKISTTRKQRPFKKRLYDSKFKLLQEVGNEDLIQKSPCRLEQLSIPLDFSDKIIAPIAFPVNYCRGYCLNPNSREPNLYQPSKSRLLDQSFPYDVASPCCVPAEMRRVSVLFIDQYNTVVLKSYPNATVTNCKSV